MSFSTYWRMTINNYDATDLALVRQGYPDDIRKLVYTLEKGEKTGTPHIQAYIQMKRSVRRSHMSKLFPRGSFGTMDSAEWRLNQHNYAQKLDATATSPATILNSDPLHTIEGAVKHVMRKVYQHMQYEDYSYGLLMQFRKMFEKRMVEDDYTYAKVFVSSTYKAMWKDYGEAMYSCIVKQMQEKEQQEKELRVRIPVDTHTHTHEDEKFSHEGGITNEDGGIEGDDACSQGGEDDSPCEDDEDYEVSAGSSDEEHDEGSGSDGDSSDDCSSE